MLKVLILFLILIQSSLYAQVDSVLRNVNTRGSFAKHLILPTSLGIAGVIVKETNFRGYFQDKVQNSRFRTNTTVDDYIQYVPMVELYIADLHFRKSKNEIFQQTKNLAIAQLLTALIVQSVKRSTNIKRPNGHDFSFFSGHTSQAFTGATALYLEYKDSNKIFALSGYGFSTTTGILRVTNNKHWLSDVLVGAGIGILSARLVWYINPLQNWKPFKNSKVAIYPFVNGLASSVGLCMVL